MTPEQETEPFARAEPVFAQLIPMQEEMDVMGLNQLQRDAATWMLGMAIAGTTLSVGSAQGYAYGRCVIAKQSLGGAIYPIFAAGDYLFEYHGNDPHYQSFSFNGAKVTLVKAPKHGQLAYTNHRLGVSDSWYTYRSKEGYVGKDRFVMDVEKDGVKVRVHYVIQVLEDFEPELGFCEPDHWKISSTNDPTQTTDLAVLLADAAMRFAGTTDPHGSAVGQTTGKEPDGKIVLDSGAAGLGWFLDLTPSQNEEFLPTSNPNEWIAKADSEAAGKMDLLTILLHEYGHVLGFDDSQDGQDFMVSTLHSGIRRTLGVHQRLQLMQLAGYFPVPDRPSSPYQTDLGAPLPFTRTNLSSRFSSARASALDRVRAKIAEVC